MGLSPTDVDKLSLAQYLAALSGWEDAHGGNDDPPPMTSREDYDRVIKDRRDAKR